MNQRHQKLIDTITAAADSDDALILLHVDSTHAHLERVSCSPRDSANGVLGLLRCTLADIEDPEYLQEVIDVITSTCAQALEAATRAEAAAEEGSNRG